MVEDKMVLYKNLYKKWLRNFLLCSFIPLSLVALFNYRVDRFGLFHLDKGLKISAMDLLNGKRLAGRLDSYEEREFQRLIVENYPKKRETVLIGSSRNMLSRKNLLGGDIDFFNHSLSGPALQDLIAISGMYKLKGNMPKTVILGIDPWIFNKNKGLPQWWKSLNRYYETIVTEIYERETQINLFQPDRYLQLINLEFTKENYKYLRKGRKLTTTDTIHINNFVREPDGSMYFPYQMRFKKAERLTPYPPNAKPLPLLNNFESLSGMELFEDFVRYLQNKKVEVVLVLLPFHPAIYKLFNENPGYRIVITLEKHLRDFALQNHIQLIGSYDPGKYQLEGKDFIDDIHGHEIVAKKVFQEYRWAKP
jgi:hypothetical protein